MYDGLVAVPKMVPVFPLPDVVLFPRQVLPLHIFEPRYRAMTRDALAGHRFIAVALLKPGFEPHYFTRCAPIHRVIGVGRIVDSQTLSGGRYNILLRGEARARIVRECGDRPYRLAQIELLHSKYHGSTEEARCLREELEQAVRSAFASNACVLGRLLELFAAPTRLDELVDLIAAALPVPGECRQLLLEQPQTILRGRLLVQQLRELCEMEPAARRLEAAATWSMN